MCQCCKKLVASVVGTSLSQPKGSREPRPSEHRHLARIMAPAPYSVELDGDTARRFAETGATLLLLGVPEHTVVGIDQQVRTFACLQGRKSQAWAELECACKQGISIPYCLLASGRQHCSSRLNKQVPSPLCN